MGILPIELGGGISALPMRESHLGQVMAIETTSFPDPWSPLAYVSELRYNHDARYEVIVDRAGAVLGYVGVWVRGDESYICQIAVAQTARRQGLGRLLVIRAGQMSRARGAHVLRLTVRESNAGAIAFYKALGFRNIGTLESYYVNPLENGLEMADGAVDMSSGGNMLEEDERVADGVPPSDADDAVRKDEAHARQDDGASRKTTDEEEANRFHTYLAGELRRYRMLAWVLGACGFALLMIAVGLNLNGIMPVKIYNIAMTVAYLFILLMAITIFTRTRPYRKRIKQLEGKPLSEIRDDSAPDGVKIDSMAQFRDMDDLYKILERDVRTEVIPDLPEYKRLRRIWLALYAAALVVGVAALVLYYLYPALSIPATLLLLAAFALVIVAFYMDRTKMKPMRVEWARGYGMTEMQLRDNLREIKAGQK